MGQRDKTVDVEAIRQDAEALYRQGHFYCSEAVVYAIREQLAPEMPESAVAMASGFPVGVGGAQCICGAVSGGVLCLGWFFGRTKPDGPEVARAMALSGELHASFAANHKVLCCRRLTKGMEKGSPEHMHQCVAFTGEVAARTAELIARELGCQTV